MTCCLEITVKLMTDTIFGSGHSIPGGEDIAVKTDSDGYPYLSGATLKGLLREETANLLDWSRAKNSEETLCALYGSGDQGNNLWHGSPSTRRVFVSRLVLKTPKKHGDDHLRLRTFTEIGENGTVKKGSLRVAACIERGTEFTGCVFCDEADKELIRDSLHCIKFMGTSRTRGMGWVEIKVQEGKMKQQHQSAGASGNCSVLTYSLTLDEPLRVTDLNTSHSMYYECCDWIPGGTVRGYVMNRLSSDEPAWFRDNKITLLRNVRFGDVILCRTEGIKAPAIPVPMGYYEKKDGSEFYSLLAEQDSDVLPETKRAKIGRFCTISGNQISGWSPETGSETRINLQKGKSRKNTTGMFQTECLLAGQKGNGLVTFDSCCSEELKRKVADVIGREMRLGAGIHSGFGLCSGSNLRWTKEAPEIAAYGFRDGDVPQKTIFLLALSPIAALNDFGDPCGLDEKILSKLLKTQVTDLKCATSVVCIRGFNATWGCRIPMENMYERGSLFRITCETAPKADVLTELQNNGIGVRRQEGFGRILFLRELPKERTRKTNNGQHKQSEESAKRSKQAKWLLENCESIPKDLSASQRSEVQEKLSVWLNDPNIRSKMGEFFEERKKKSPAFREKYKSMQVFVDNLLADNTIPADGLAERAALISELFDFGRKGGK